MIGRLLIGCLLLGAPVSAESLSATRVIRANAIIGPTDVAVINVTVPGAIASINDIVGFEARITLYPGRPILAAHVGPAALVERNQPVVLRYEKGGLSIATEARALSRGAVGETVRVMNLASRSTVVGRVEQDGSVIVTVERSAP